MTSPIRQFPRVNFPNSRRSPRHQCPLILKILHSKFPSLPVRLHLGYSESGRDVLFGAISFCNKLLRWDGKTIGGAELTWSL